MRGLDAYLGLTSDQARLQWRSLMRRRPLKRQVPFEPVETLLCLGVSFLVNHRRYGGRTAHLAPTPVPELAALFQRPPSSVLAKMANLDGSRVNGAKFDLLAGATLREQTDQFTHIYRVILSAARSEGIDQDALPDFLELEVSGELLLLGQDELDPGALETALSSEVQLWLSEGVDLTERETERLLMARTRVGQHVFARQVLSNCGHACVFCGLKPAKSTAPRMLIASHIKPWKDSSPRERLDHQNGLAACPTHDVAFDAGLLTVNGGLQIHISPTLAEGMSRDPVARSYFGRPPLLDKILLPPNADPPGRPYLTWHKSHVFQLD